MSEEYEVLLSFFGCFADCDHGGTGAEVSGP